MSEQQKKPEPKKIKMPPLVDRSEAYDTLSFDNDTLYEIHKSIDNENNPENNSQSVSELESM
jgi:hypothetical protein